MFYTYKVVSCSIFILCISSYLDSICILYLKSKFVLYYKINLCVGQRFTDMCCTYWPERRYGSGGAKQRHQRRDRCRASPPYLQEARATYLKRVAWQTTLVPSAPSALSNRAHLSRKDGCNVGVKVLVHQGVLLERGGGDDVAVGRPVCSVQFERPLPAVPPRE